jgi:hypothetical protein
MTRRSNVGDGTLITLEPDCPPQVVTGHIRRGWAANRVIRQTG